MQPSIGYADVNMHHADKRNILYILPKSDYFSRGKRGSVVHAIGVINGLLANGHDVTVLSGRGLRDLRNGIGARAELVEVREPQGLGWLFALGREARMRHGRAGGFDVVIIRYRTSCGPLLARLALSLPDTLRVVEVNSLGFHQTSGLPIWLRAPLLMWECGLLRRFDRCYVISDQLKRDICRRPLINRLSPERVLVVPNAADPTLTCRDTDAGDGMVEAIGGNAPLRFAYLGVLQSYYDFELMIAAFREYHTENRATELHLWGDGPLLAKARAAATNHANIFFHGRYDISAFDARRSLGDAVLLLPYGTVGQDFRSPIKLFEYMALGYPIIASAVGQITDILQDGRTGLLYQPGSVHDLVRCLRELGVDSARRLRMAQAVRDDFRQNHTWTLRMKQLVAQLPPHA